MGNCLVSQEKMVRVVKPDGKVLEYKAPLKVHQVLSDFEGHAISERLASVRHLRQDADLLGGRLYYLLPLPEPLPEFDKAMLRHSNPEVEVREEKGAVRIKLVISKQELEAMLRKGLVSIGEAMKGTNKLDGDAECNNESSKGWKPVLESIPEAD